MSAYKSYICTCGRPLLEYYVSYDEFRAKMKREKNLKKMTVSTIVGNDVLGSEKYGNEHPELLVCCLNKLNGRYKETNYPLIRPRD